MNRCSYKSLFNHALGAWQTVSELTRSAGKKSVKGVAVSVLGLLATGHGFAAVSVDLTTPGANFDISASGDQTIDTLSGVTGSTVTLGANTLTLGDTTNRTFNGVISGPGRLVKDGTGLQTLGAVNLFSGGVTLNSGGLIVDNASALGTGTLLVNGASTLNSLNSAVAIANGITLNANLSNTSETSLSLNGMISGAGQLIKSGSGTLTLSGMSTWAGGTSLNGGVLSINNGSALGAGGLTASGTATLRNTQSIVLGNALLVNGNLTLDTVTGLTQSGLISGNGTLIKTGNDELVIIGNNSFSGNWDIANGAVTALTAAALGIPGQVNVNSGAMLNTNQNTSIGALTGNGIANIGLGSVLSIGDGNNDSLFGGALSGNGALRKVGDGVLELSGISSLAGSNQVSSGTLKVSGSLNGGGVTVMSGATLSGSGSIGGAVSVVNNGHLAGTSGGTMNFGSLTLAPNAMIDVTLGSPVTGSTPLFNVAGTLTLDGVLNVMDDGGFGNGIYRLFNYTSMVNNGVTLGSLPSGLTPSGLQLQTAIAGQVNLLVNSPNLIVQFWDGGSFVANGVVQGGPGVWNNSGTNWTDLNGAGQDSWRNQFAVFQGASGTVTVESTQTVDGMQFLTDGYQLIAGVDGAINAVNRNGSTFAVRVDPGVTATVDVDINGSGTLKKLDNGTLVLNGANGYTGNTILNGGTIVVGNNSALGTGSLTTAAGTAIDSNKQVSLSNDLVLNGGLTVLGSNALTLNGNISGTGSLTKNGVATLTLNGTNTYTGGTNINAGTLALGLGASLASSGIVNVATGATFDLSEGNGTQTFGTLVGGGTVNLGSNALTIGGPTDDVFSGSITGTGGLIKEGTGTSTLTGTNTFTGGTLINAGTLAIGAGGSLAATGTLTLAAADTGFDISAGGNQAIGRLNGVVGSTVRLGGNTLTITGTANGIYDGVIAGAGGLIKNGTGVQTLGGANTFSGGITLNAGGLMLTNNGALGTGALSVGGIATLDNNAALTVGNQISVAPSAVLTVLSSHDLTLTNAISGNGRVTKNGASTLTLSGTNSYHGGTTINAGTLAIGAGGNLSTTGAVNLAGLGTFDISAAGNQMIGPLSGVAGSTITLGGNTLTFGNANAATFNGSLNGAGGLIKNGAGVQTLGGASTFDGGVTLNSGGLDLGNDAALGTGSLTVGGAATLNSTSAFTLANDIVLNAGLTALGRNNLTLSGSLTGAGSLTKEGLSTLSLSGTNTYNGGTRIDAGTLAVNGSLTGLTTVNAGGTLGGTGTVGDVIVASGGTLNPGNSIGTLRVNGDLTFTAGSIYEVEANAAGQSDKVIVHGTATLNGNVVALPENGAYQANTPYTILTSTNALVGQFNSNVTSSLVFLNASLTHDTNNVYLNLARNNIAYADVANTRNQRGIANALQNASTAGGNSADMDTVLTEVNNLSADNARAAFTSMNGAGLVSLRRASTNFTGNFGNQLMGRLQSAGMGSTAQSLNGMQLAANDRLGDLMPALAQNTRSDVPASNKFSLSGGVPVEDGKRGFWLRGFGFDQDTDGDGNAAGSRIKGVGITGGFDTRVRSDLVVGVAFSHATSDVRATFSETGKSRGNAAAVYASYASGPWNVNGNLTLAHNANSMNRNITVGAISRTAKARFDSKTVSAYGEVSYDLPQATWTLQPLAALGVTHNRNDGFTETGADPLNIQANAQNITSTKTLFGARALFDLDGIQVQPRAIWAHELGDVNKALTAQLQGAPAAAFTTYGVDLPRDSFITGLTVAGRTKDGLSLFADVQGEFNSKQTGVALLVGLRKSW